jgi:hypothetical protein
MKTTIGYTYNHKKYMKSVRGKFNYVRDEVTKKAGGVSVTGRKRAKPCVKSRVDGPSITLALAGPSTSAFANFLSEDDNDDDDDDDDDQTIFGEQSEAEDSDEEQLPKGKKSAKVRNTVNTR